MSKRDLAKCEKEELIMMIEELQSKLKKKNAEFLRVRVKLSETKIKLARKNDIVVFQRDRILQLYTTPLQNDVPGRA